MGHVYIVQEPMRRDADGEMVSLMDFRKALTYGDPVVCLKSGRVSFSPAPMIHRLKDVLRDFNDDDYLIAAGDPSAIAAAAIIAAKNNMGRVNLLKWDKVAKTYIKVGIDTNI